MAGAPVSFGSLVYFVKTVAEAGGRTPHDTNNDGRDCFGFVLGATGAFTTSTKNLNKTAAFTSYVWVAGDLIYINAGTGVTVGLYEIASKTDSDNIVLATDIGGTDPTDVDSSTGPYLTITKANSVLAANNIVFICDDGAHVSETAAVSVSTRVRFWGASARGVRYKNVGEQAEVDFSGSTADDGFRLDTGSTEVVFGHLDVHSAPLMGINCEVTGQPLSPFMFVYCTVRDNTGGGIDGEGHKLLIACQTYGNGGSGVGCNDQSSRARTTAIYCSSHDNGLHGFQSASGSVYVHCISYDNADDGFHFFSSAYSQTMVNCVSNGNADDGVYNGANTNSHVTLLQCAISNNGGWGFDSAGAASALMQEFHYNLFYNNTGGDATNPLPDDDTSITGSDPLFVSVTDGSEDFTPKSNSPLVDAGIFGPRTS